MIRPLIRLSSERLRSRRLICLGRRPQRLIERDGRVNGELYVDTCIEDAIALGYRCVVFEVDHYLCWGVPNDLKTFEYWQSCFHKWPSHPYTWERDRWHPSAKSNQANSDSANLAHLTATYPALLTIR